MIRDLSSVYQIEDYMIKCELPRGDFSSVDIQAIWEDIKALEKGSVVVEIGVRFGCSLTAIAILAKEGVQITGIDIEDPEGRKEYWERCGLDKVAKFICGKSVEVAKDWNTPIDFLHIDGNHFYDGCKSDIDAWLPHMKKGGVMAFHDFDESSPGVMHAVTELVDTRGRGLRQFIQMKKLIPGTSIAKVYV
jgi:predicted O-methyltransferase YrrM